MFRFLVLASRSVSSSMEVSVPANWEAVMGVVSHTTQTRLIHVTPFSSILQHHSFTPEKPTPVAFAT